MDQDDSHLAGSDQFKLYDPGKEELAFALQVYLQGRDRILWDIQELWCDDPVDYHVEEMETMMADIVHIMADEFGLE